MLLLHPGGLHQTFVVVENGLREARGTGGEVDGGIILVLDPDQRCGGGEVHHLVIIILGKGGTYPGAHIHQQPLFAQFVGDFLHTANELRAEQQNVGVGEHGAVADLLGGKAEVHGHDHSAGFENAKVDG